MLRKLRNRMKVGHDRVEWGLAAFIALAVVVVEWRMGLLVKTYFFTVEHQDWYLDRIFLASFAACVALAFLGVRRSFRLRREIRRRVAAEQTAQTLANYDPLTGLANRTKFIEELAEAVLRAKTYNTSAAVLLIDLDRFKSINELYGHSAGDKVLTEIAGRLRRVLRAGDSVARIGGDEFALTVSVNFDDDIPVRVAQRVINTVVQPILLGNARVEVSVAVGIALCPSDGTDPNGLLHAAERAMDRARGEGRGKYRFFEEGMDEQLRARALVEQELKSAASSDQIRPYYQPIVELATGVISGFEILARWHHPDHGILPPAAFIPIAEDTGQISGLSYRLLQRACEETKSWPYHLTLSLNIAPCQLEERSLPHEILKVLRETDFDPSRLIIEVTEAALIKNLDIARDGLEILKREGVRIELDDFGIGYSSLYHLRELSFDAIKIDRSFIQSLRQGEENKRILAAIINLGHTLNLSTVAEGIEDESDFALLSGLGCQYGQGHFFGKPLPAHEAELLVTERPALVKRN